MHYTGTIWRPPYEAFSLLLEVTAGCTHNQCKFCTLYEELPFKFRRSPMETIKEDIKEAGEMYKSRKHQPVTRTFLTGANPFVLGFDKLMEIAAAVRQEFPEMETIGSFARVTDITLKTDEELSVLQQNGYDGLTIGIETGDDEALSFMNKGYEAADILTQCRRLDKAGIRYSFFYLVGISGAGRGEIGAMATAEIINQLHPLVVGANMLTIYPDSELYEEIQKGNWQPESELEKYNEIRLLIEKLNVSATFAAMGASNAFQIHGALPGDKQALLAEVDHIIGNFSELELQNYRRRVYHL